MGEAARAVRPALGLDPVACGLAADDFISSSRDQLGVGVGITLTRPPDWSPVLFILPCDDL